MVKPENINAQVDDFVKAVNKLRKESKEKWYRYDAIVAGRSVSVQGFKTWLRNYKVDGVEHGNCMDRKPGEFLADLREPFRRLAIG